MNRYRLTAHQEPVFVGIGSDDDVARYLGDVAHDELIDFHGGAGLGMFVVSLMKSVGAVVVILLIGRRASPDSTTG